MTLAPADGESPLRGEAPGTYVRSRPGEQPGALLARIGLRADVPGPVIVVSGGADDLDGEHLEAARTVLGPGVAAAASLTGAAIVDGGTAYGVMALLGDERARDPARMPLLLGVAPAGKVDAAGPGDDSFSLDPHHTHFVLADSDEWGGETPLLAAVADELAHGAPVALVLAGGGEGAMQEVREAVKRDWTLFVLEGTGGLADEIAATRSGRRKDPRLRDELQPGDVRLVPRGDPAALGRSLAWELADEPALKDAWSLFATYDVLAVKLRDAFELVQTSILLLGLVATAIALTHDATPEGSARDVLHWGAVTLPIVVSVLIALANRRAAGKRWVLLRAAAEAVKSEIYRYRTRTGSYSEASITASDPTADRPQLLATRVEAIEAALIQTDASGGPLTPYDGPVPPAGGEAGDDALSPLTAMRYVEIRLVDQLGYYRGKVRRLDRRRARLQLVTLAAGGAGALLAAAGAEIWIGLTTAVAGAALAHLGYLQVDDTIVATNQAATQLDALRRQFRASGGTAPGVDELVTRCEATLMTELGGWVQQMTDTLAQLQAEQAEATTPGKPAPNG